MDYSSVTVTPTANAPTVSIDDYEELDEIFASNFPFYCSELVFIKNKAGEVAPFVMNKAQTYTHLRLEKQLEEFGRVRAIILKGRQLGISTYTAARFYYNTTAFYL